MIVPTYLPYYVAVMPAVQAAAILLGMRGALRNAGWAVHERAAAWQP